MLAVVFGILPGTALLAAGKPRSRWTPDQATAYMQRQPYPVGANFLPKNSINELEMWQAATFDPSEIDTELGRAQGIGMTTMRVFLHDLLWQGDSAGLLQRMEQFLAISKKHGIKPVFVLFDSCWDPNPRLGQQHAPIPGVHNSGWVQAPGVALADPAQHKRFEAYVKGVVGHFANDDRILAWDVWNEPDNGGGGNYADNLPDKVALMDAMLPEVFAWARAEGPSQPLTSGIWHDEATWSDPSKWTATEKIQLSESDIISFHNYDWPEKFQARIDSLKPLGRPLLCTEYMARGNGSTFDGNLPVAAKNNVGAINWGLVQGKEQTNLPWDSWAHPYTDREPPIWFHDVFYSDGRPYREAEVNLIRQISQEKNAAK
ncbi:hypothetical protein GCM10022270_15370 [Terriglobus aquaticus]